MGIYEREKIELYCTGCGHLFEMGDTINLFRLGLNNGDYCNLCKDKILGFIETLGTKQLPTIQ